MTSETMATPGLSAHEVREAFAGRLLLPADEGKADHTPGIVS